MREKTIILSKLTTKTCTIRNIAAHVYKMEMEIEMIPFIVRTGCKISFCVKVGPCIQVRGRSRGVFGIPNLKVRRKMACRY